MKKGDRMKNAMLFLVLVSHHRRIRISTLAEHLECSSRHVYNLIDTASPYIPLRVESGVVINENARPMPVRL